MAGTEPEGPTPTNGSQLQDSNPVTPASILSALTTTDENTDVDDASDPQSQNAQQPTAAVQEPLQQTRWESPPPPPVIKVARVAERDVEMIRDLVKAYEGVESQFCWSGQATLPESCRPKFYFGETTDDSEGIGSAQ